MAAVVLNQLATLLFARCREHFPTPPGEPGDLCDRDDQRAKIRRFLKLAAGLHREHLMFPVKRSGGQVQHCPR